MNQKTQIIRDEVMRSALPLVVFDGWTKNVLEQAAQQAGYDRQIIKAVFPEGMIGVLDHFTDMADSQMLAKLQDIDPEELRVRDRVRMALIKRYEFLMPYKEVVKAMLAYFSVPLRKPRAAKMVWRTADRVWQWAGDTATDYNHYTKRGLLSAIIVPTTLVWLNDETEDMAITQGFLDRRIENVMTLGKFTGEIAGHLKKSGYR